MTSVQAHVLGVRIRSGERPFPVTIFRNWYMDVYDSLEKAEKKGYAYRQLLTYRGVFNMEQTDLAHRRPDLGEMIEERYASPAAEPGREVSVPCVDRMLDTQGWLCPIRQSRSEDAFYSPSGDYICVPSRERFADRGEFYGTLFHEMSHSTGAEGRIGRDIRNPFGSDGYARDELVAELSSAVLNGMAGIDSTIREDNLRYLKHWQERFAGEPMAIMSVLSDASKAAAMISGQIGLVQERIVELDAIRSELDGKRPDIPAEEAVRTVDRPFGRTIR